VCSSRANIAAVERPPTPLSGWKKYIFLFIVYKINASPRVIQFARLARIKFECLCKYKRAGKYICCSVRQEELLVWRPENLIKTQMAQFPPQC
jgi:hypothetical protein